MTSARPPSGSYEHACDLAKPPEDGADVSLDVVWRQARQCYGRYRGERVVPTLPSRGCFDRLEMMPMMAQGRTWNMDTITLDGKGGGMRTGHSERVRLLAW